MNYEDVREHYKKRNVARDYDKKRFSNKTGRHINYTEQKIVAELTAGLAAGSHVLDLAAGSGRFTIMLAKMGFKVTAFDYSQEMLNLIAEKCSKEGLIAGKDIFLVHGDANNPPFEPETFDAAISMRFLWHYKDMEYKKYIDNVMNMLKKDGFFVFDLFNIYSLRALYTPIANLSVYVNLTTRKSFYRFVRERNYRIEKQRTYFFFPYLFFRYCPDFLAGTLIWLENQIQSSALNIFSTNMYFRLRKRP